MKLKIHTHYIVASEHLETIDAYLKNTGMENVKVVRGLGWETGGDLSLALEQINLTEEPACKVVQNIDIVSIRDESLCKMRTKKSGSTRNQHLHSLPYP